MTTAGPLLFSSVFLVYESYVVWLARARPSHSSDHRTMYTTRPEMILILFVVVFRVCISRLRFECCGL